MKLIGGGDCTCKMDDDPDAAAGGDDDNDGNFHDGRRRKPSHGEESSRIRENKSDRKGLLFICFIVMVQVVVFISSSNYVNSDIAMVDRSLIMMCLCRFFTFFLVLIE